MKALVFTLAIVTAFLLHSSSVHAEENKTLKGTIISTQAISESKKKELPPNSRLFVVELKNQQGQKVSAFADPKMPNVKLGDDVLLVHTIGPKEESIYYVTDHVRTDSILFLFLIFVSTVVLISRKAGLLSLLGMGYSFLIIFKFLLPQLYAGNNPILISLLSVMLIAPVTFVLSHGFNQKTFTALGATIISLTLTSILALIFINYSHLSGFGSEEAYFLQLAQGTLNIKGIFLAGIIIGTLGILDDATVTQTSIVAQLKATTRDLRGFDLFGNAMAVGHDHIASTVNTLILVYTGASLPLLLLFIQSNESFITVLNNQIIAEEIVTMLVSSIGLIISIPIATMMAVHFVSKESAVSSHHHH
jgi:uncharacterized membrane protein